MKAVVTGGAGFIGSHLVRELAAGEHEVHVIDDLSTGNAANVHSKATLHVQDICSRKAGETIASLRPDVVFHLAAQADVQRSIKEPYTDASINIAGTARLLAACREARVRKLVFASTSAVYGELQKDLITEEDPTEPVSFYGMSKWTAERYIRLFHRLHGISYTILRYGNVYGPGQTAKGEGGVIALFMERLVKGEPLVIHGDGEQTRDFIFVRDVVRANLACIALGDGQTLHVSTGQKTSVNRLAELLRECHGKSFPLHYGPARPGDIKHSCLSRHKAGQLLSWQPEREIRSGLDETYRHWLKRRN